MAELTVDVAVCVHNALDDVRECLASVLAKSPQMRKLWVIDDGSVAATAAWLHDFTEQHTGLVSLLRHESAQGYTRAASRALQLSDADVVVLLNSDTVVSTDWLEHLLECFASDAAIGIVGPLSNAASWQSVPQRFDAAGDWHLNPLPDGWTVDDMAAAVAQVSKRDFPLVPFVNGFCFAIRRELIAAIGVFDAQHFPHGYGEENDYCLRAAKAGFKLAIADQAYVFHAKSKSFSHERRRSLSAAGGKMLQKKHGWWRMWRNVRRMRQNRALLEMAERLQQYLKDQGLAD